MPIFGKLGDLIKSMGDQLDGLLKQVTDGAGLDRLTAVGVLVGRADGEIDAGEIEKLQTICTRNMPHFTEDQIRQSFVKNRNRTDDELKDLIDKAPGPDIDVLIRAGLAIGGADGDFDEDEQKVMRDLCLMLFKKPADYGL